MTGFASQLNLVNWQFFCTFTEPDIDGRPPGQGLLVKGWYSAIRKIESRFQSRSKSLLWAMRLEQGEQHMRWHIHVLLGGLPYHLQSLNTCHVLEGVWGNITGGIAQVRIWNPTLDGVSYVLKHGANAYEQGKFGNDHAEVTLSPAMITRIRQARTVEPHNAHWVRRRLAKKLASSEPRDDNTETPR